jgi:hypothetical protein
MKKLISSILIALFVGIVVIAPSDTAQAQVAYSNRCCDGNGIIRCTMGAFWPIGSGCFCYGQGSGWVC